jgi:phosphoribosylcarboxyaminoimidazole (NCAIR) mutase
MSSAETDLSVLAVAPKKTDADAISSMIAMPAGVPLAFMGSGRAGAINAALFAVKNLFAYVDGLRGRYNEYKREMQESVPFAP